MYLLSGKYSFKLKYFYIIFIFFSIINFAQNNNGNVDNKLSFNSLKSPYLQKDNLSNHQLLILPLGNSITYDYRVGDSRVPEDKYGYRLPLYNLLKNVGFNFDFIGSEHSGSNYLPAGYDGNAGFPGIKDDQLNYLLRTGIRNQPPDFNNVVITSGPYLDTYLPDLILLHIGTNGNNETGGTSPADVANILDEVDRVENLFNVKIPVIIARIVNRVPNQTYVNDFNDSVETMVWDRVNNISNPAYPDDLYMVDMQDSAGIDYTIDSFGTIGDGIPGDMSDYLHPNDKGFAKMANVWFDEIIKIFPKTVTIVKQPSNIRSVLGQQIVFSVSANSNDSIYYQWKKNGIDIPGATDSILIPNLSMDDDSSKFVCELQSGYYSVLSDTATLYLTDSTSRVEDGILAYYNFEEGIGDTIRNEVTKYMDLNLIIDDTSRVKWIPFGLQLKDTSQIHTANSAKDIYMKVKNSNEITLDAWIKPDNNIQMGPARIITISQGASNRNITLGQDADKFELRLRTTETSNNGIPSYLTTDNTAKHELTHIVYTRNAEGKGYIYINGETNTEYFLNGDFSNWDSTYVLGIGNEFSAERHWLGEFYSLSIYDRALDSIEVYQNFKMKFNGYYNLLEKPSNLTATMNNLTNVMLSWVDNSHNEVGFIIERKAKDIDSVFSVIDTVGINSVSYLDSTKKLDSSYIYRIRAYKDIYYSDYSNEAEIDDLPVSVNNGSNVVDNFQLFQNYPNPFNPTTILKFSIAKESQVELKVFNVLGENVKTFFNKKIVSKGIYSLTFNGAGLPSGIYLYRLIAKPLDGSPSFIKVNKANLIK